MNRKEAILLHGICHQLVNTLPLAALAHRVSEALKNRAENPRPGDFVLIQFLLKPDPLKAIGWLKEAHTTGLGLYVIEALDGTEARYENVKCTAVPLKYLGGGLMTADEVEEQFRVGREDLLAPAVEEATV